MLVGRVEDLSRARPGPYHGPHTAAGEVLQLLVGQLEAALLDERGKLFERLAGLEPLLQLGGQVFELHGAFLSS